MPSLLQSLLLLALITLALAAPKPTIQKRGSFKVERVANPNFRREVNHVRSVGAGTRALIKAHRKYSVPLPAGLIDAMNAANAGAATTGAAGVVEELTNSLAEAGNNKAGKKKGGAAAAAAGAATGAATGTGKAGKGSASSNSTTSTTGKTSAPAGNTNGTGSVTATPEAGDVEYLSPVNIGGQVINMDFDSGSSDLWVFNTQLPAASIAKHTAFDLTKSTAFKMMTGATYSISYGDGSGSAGNVGTDTVNIGGVSVTSQAVELPTAVSTSFVSDANSNGLVGLAFSKLNTVKPTQQKTFFDNAAASLKTPVFTADLRPGVPGAYEFGTIDSTKFNGTMQWAAVNTTNGFWQFSSQSAAVSGTTLKNTGGQAIADTGTTLMLVNSAIVNSYYSGVTGAANDATVGGVTFPCSATLPDLAVDIGGFMATVKGTDINFAPVDAAGTTCFGGVQAIDSSLQIYGDIMFKSQFVAFNSGNNSIGMAPHL